MTREANGPVSAREIELGTQGAVEIALSASTVRLRGIDSTRLTVRVPSDREIDEELVIDERPGRVQVREVEHGYRLGPIRMRSRPPVPVEIDLPRDATVDLQTLSGDVVAAGIDGSSRWSTASGDLRLEVGDGSVTTESMSGDVSLVAANPVAVAMRAVSGDVRIRAGRIGELVVSTTSGRIGVETALDQHREHRLTSVSGSVELLTPSPVRVETASITGDLRASGVEPHDARHGARTLVSGDGSVRVSIRTTSGDIRLRVGVLANVAHPEGTHSDASRVEPGEPTTPPEAAARRDAARLEVLRALERGDLDVDSATRELEVLETGGRIDG
jgi:hypothetical protein